MRKSLLKKVSAVVCATVLTIASTCTCFAADNWTSYFGMNMGWYEGALGTLDAHSETGWTANLQQIGWGGVWGAQVKDEAISIKGGTDYTLSFDMVSDTIDKAVFIKITDDSTENPPILYGKWVLLKAGQTYSFNETINLPSDGTKIFFGIGGEMGDRADEEELYALLDDPTNKPSDVDALYTTTITVSNYSLAEKTADAPAPDNGEDDDDNEGAVGGGNDNTNNNNTNNNSGGNSNVVATGDFTPIACAVVAVVAAAGIVVFTRKREEA